MCKIKKQSLDFPFFLQKTAGVQKFITTTSVSPGPTSVRGGSPPSLSVSGQAQWASL